MALYHKIVRKLCHDHISVPVGALMTAPQNEQGPDELFLDQLKDQFVLFYLLTVTGIELAKTAQRHYQKKAAQTEKNI